MPAKDYHLVVSGMGTPYIAKISKKTKHLMLADRIKVDSNEFIDAILQWGKCQLDDNSDTVYITADGKVIAEIIFKENN